MPSSPNSDFIEALSATLPPDAVTEKGTKAIQPVVRAGSWLLLRFVRLPRNFYLAAIPCRYHPRRVSSADLAAT
jgi:hypothetical protein